MKSGDVLRRIQTIKRIQRQNNWTLAPEMKKELDSLVEMRQATCMEYMFGK